MAWYYGKYTCGHAGRVNVTGVMSERQWKIDKHFEGICEECKAKEREEANKKAIEKSREYEFPILRGTEKQVAWANTIRIAFYNKCAKAHVDSSSVIKYKTVNSINFFRNSLAECEVVTNATSKYKVSGYFI